MTKIGRALISVTDKKGIVELAKGLKGFGVEILSTGGTAAAIKAAGIDVTDVSAYTGFPEMMGGRLKTLHPKVHGGLLALRDHDEHMKSARAHGIGMIDMVVINLYRFEDTQMRVDEERNLARLVKEGKLSREEKAEKKERMGHILIVSDLDRPPEAVFLLYKRRDNVEKQFEVWKTTLQADRTWLRDDASIFGHVFV